MNTPRKQIEEVMLKYDFAKQILETQLQILIKEFEFKHGYNPVEHIKSRIKSEQSIIAKLKRKNYICTMENMQSHIHDIIGIRLVCSFLSDVYDIVEVIKSSKQITIKEEKDYINSPKESGYISYHLIVLIPIYLHDTTEYVEAEIQIRTIAMDFWASLDHKMRYKFLGESPKEVKEELYQCALDIKALDKRMNELNQFINKYDCDNENMEGKL